MLIEIRNHPAQARHPVTREPLFDDAGLPVPLILDQRGIWLDGYHVGYCGVRPGAPISIVRPCAPAVVEAIRAKVEATFGLPGQVFAAPDQDAVRDAIAASEREEDE